MADIKGTNVASKIVPYTTSDNYATHDEEYGRGGYRTVNTVAEMNAIPADRRKEGMLVYVKNDKYYRLNSSNTFEDAGIGSSGGSGLDWDSAHNFSQNGYQKFNNGLMIQWGYMSPSSMNSTTGQQIINLPLSFYDTYYTVVTTVISTHSSPIVKEIVSKYKSYFIIKSIQYGTIAGEPYNWFAIGRWK